MLVKYVKDGLSGKIGDVREHSAAQARVLMKLGIVVAHEPAKPKRGRKPKKGEVFGNLPRESADDATTSKKEKAGK